MGLGIFKLIWLRILFLTMTPCPQAHGSEWQEFLSSFERGPSALEAFCPQSFPEGTAFRLAINAQNAAFWMKQHIWSVLFCVKTQPGWDHDPVPHTPLPTSVLCRLVSWAEPPQLFPSPPPCPGWPETSPWALVCCQLCLWCLLQFLGGEAALNSGWITMFLWLMAQGTCPGLWWTPLTLWVTELNCKGWINSLATMEFTPMTQGCWCFPFVFLNLHFYVSQSHS